MAAPRVQAMLNWLAQVVEPYLLASPPVARLGTRKRLI
jgi:hypothetical protein